MTIPLFNVNIESDGAWDIDGAWYGSAVLTELFPRYVWYDFNRLAELAYITEEEYDLILTNFPDYIRPYQTIGYFSTETRPSQLLNFIGPLMPAQPGQRFGNTQHTPVDNVPVYYIIAQGQPVHKLVYISVEAREFLKEQDIYGVGLATTRFAGPGDIPIYGGGDSCGPGGVGDTGCDPGGPDGPSDAVPEPAPPPALFPVVGKPEGKLGLQPCPPELPP